MSENSKFWQASFFLPKDISDNLAENYLECFEDFAHSALLRADDDKGWALELMFRGEDAPKAKDIITHFQLFSDINLSEQDISIENVPDKNWLIHVYQELEPFQVGDFFIYGHHYTGEVPTGLIPIQIHAAEAFGSGEHDTTQGCLLAMQKLFADGHKFHNILDMGCGSGILSLAAAHLWPNAKITAIDIEEDAITATENHAQNNGFQYHIACECGDGYNSPLTKKHGPYDLILANILASVLLEMASELNNNLMNDGYAILAGLLTRQKQDVLSRHEQENLQLVSEEESNNWSILTLKK